MAKHQCVQFGVCPRADRGECFEVNADFRCARDPEDPDCQSKLEEVGGGRSGGGKLVIKLGILALVLVIAGVAIFFATREPKASPGTSSHPTAEALLKEVWPWLR